MNVKILLLSSAILFACSAPGVNTLSAYSQQAAMRQVVIGIGDNQLESANDAKAQAKVIAGGPYTIISQETRFRSATRDWQTRLVIEF